jgi:hypothetical protein
MPFASGRGSVTAPRSDHAVRSLSLPTPTEIVLDAAAWS